MSTPEALASLAYPLTLEQRIDMRKKERIKKAPKLAVVNNGTVNHKKHPYKGLELAPFIGRPGAMDAFDLPSRMGNIRRYRDGRETDA